MNSLEKLKEWAYDQYAEEPTQDFDLTVIALNINNMIVEFASDSACPKQEFFLSCLYLIVGDAVMTEGKGDHTLQAVQELLKQCQHIKIPEIQRWITDSEHLLLNPDEFEYDAWCAGGLAAAMF